MKKVIFTIVVMIMMVSVAVGATIKLNEPEKEWRTLTRADLLSSFSYSEGEWKIDGELGEGTLHNYSESKTNELGNYPTKVTIEDKIEVGNGWVGSYTIEIKDHQIEILK